METLQWADGLLLVYSITDRGSFNFVRKAKEALAVADPEAAMPLALVGNKADMVHLRQVSTEEGEILAKDFECWFSEITAAEQVYVFYARSTFNNSHVNVSSNCKFRRLLKSQNPFMNYAEKFSQPEEGTSSPCWTECSAAKRHALTREGKAIPRCRRNNITSSGILEHVTNIKKKCLMKRLDCVLKKSRQSATMQIERRERERKRGELRMPKKMSQLLIDIR